MGAELCTAQPARLTAELGGGWGVEFRTSMCSRRYDYISNRGGRKEVRFLQVRLLVIPCSSLDARMPLTSTPCIECSSRFMKSLPVRRALLLPVPTLLSRAGDSTTVPECHAFARLRSWEDAASGTLAATRFLDVSWLGRPPFGCQEDQACSDLLGAGAEAIYQIKAISGSTCFLPAPS